MTYGEMAAAHGITEEQMQQEELEAKQAHKNVMQLSTIPMVQPQVPTQIATGPLSGETIYMWQVCDTAVADEGGPGLRDFLNWSSVPVGYWPTIEREVAKYQRAKVLWEKRVAKGLRTAQQREAYATFLADKLRHCFFHRDTDIEIKPSDIVRRSAKFLTEKTVKLSLDMEIPAVSAPPDGTWYRLRMFKMAANTGPEGRATVADLKGPAPVYDGPDPASEDEDSSDREVPGENDDVPDFVPTHVPGKPPMQEEPDDPIPESDHDSDTTLEMGEAGHQRKGQSRWVPVINLIKAGEHFINDVTKARAGTEHDGGAHRFSTPEVDKHLAPQRQGVRVQLHTTRSQGNPALGRSKSRGWALPEGQAPGGYICTSIRARAFVRARLFPQVDLAGVVPWRNTEGLAFVKLQHGLQSKLGRTRCLEPLVWESRTGGYTCMYIHTYVCEYAMLGGRTSLHGAHMYARVHVGMYIHVLAHASVVVHACVRVHVCTYIHM